MSVLIGVRRLAEHRSRSLLAVLGIAIGTCLTVVVLTLYTSLDHAVNVYTRGLVSTVDLEVSGVTENGFNQNLFFDVAGVKGVATAAPLVRAPVVIAGTPAVLIGADDRIRSLGLRTGRPADADGLFVGATLARERGLHVGDRVSVDASTETPRRARVVGIVSNDEAARVNNGYFAVAPLPLAQVLAGKGENIDSILIAARSGTDRVELQQRITAAVTGRAVVDSPALRAEQAGALSEPLRRAALAIALLVLLVGAFLAFTTMSMGALERHREVATIRALGGSRRVVVGALAVEAGIIGAAGAAAGYAGGRQLAGHLVDQLPSFVVESYGVRIAPFVPGFLLPLVLILGTIVSVAAAVPPALRTARLAPIAAMRPDEIQDTDEGRTKWAAGMSGLAMLALGLVGGFVGHPVLALLAGGLILLGMVAAAYGFLPLVTRAVAAIARGFGVAGYMAATTLERSPRRVWIIVTAVSISVVAVVGESGVLANVDASVRAEVAPLSTADLYLTTARRGALATDVLMTEGTKDAVTAVAGVANVFGHQLAFATLGQSRVLLEGYEPGSRLESVGSMPDTVRRDLEAGRGVVVSRPVARRHGLVTGTRFDLPTPTGLRQARVLAVVDSFFWPQGVVLLSIEHLQAWFQRPGYSHLEVDFAPWADAAVVRRQVAAIVARSPAAILVLDGREAVQVVERAVQQASSIFGLMQWVIVFASFLAIANIFLISVAQRRRELGLLRAIGTARRHVNRMVLIEAVAIAAVGVVMGLSVGSAFHRTQTPAMATMTGFPFEYAFVARSLVVAAVSAVVVAAVASAGPARRAARLNIVEAIGYE